MRVAASFKLKLKIPPPLSPPTPPPPPVNSLPNFTPPPPSSKSFVFAKAKFSQSINDERRNVWGFVKVVFFFAVILGLKTTLTLPSS